MTKKNISKCSSIVPSKEGNTNQYNFDISSYVGQNGKDRQKFQRVDMGKPTPFTAAGIAN